MIKLKQEKIIIITWNNYNKNVICMLCSKQCWNLNERKTKLNLVINSATFVWSVY
jgi:hypothetical protein